MRFGPGTISALAVREVVDGLESLGLDAAPALQSAGISRAKLDDPERRFRAPKAGRIWTAAIDLSGDEDIGLRLAHHTDSPDRLELLGRLLISSETIGDVWRRLCRFGALLMDRMEMCLQEAGDTVVWTCRVNVPVTLPRCVHEYSVALHTLRTRALVGDDWAPLEVSFMHERPGDTSAHEELFGCPLVFGARMNSVVVSRDLMHRPVSSADPVLSEILERYSEERLQRLPEDGELDRLKAEVEARLCDGKPHAVEVARACGMSERTMHRRLKERGLSFRTLVEDIRHAKARSYLSRPGLSVAEIAFLLGFSESSAFRRAFKSWAGVSPAGFRRQSAWPSSA